jgi:cyclophilin family peptidyl-prolyl cis-trans isomerase
MPLHADAIPTNEQVRETLFDRFYFPYKKQIWAGILLLSAAIVGYLAVREYRLRRMDEQWTRYAAAIETGRAGTGAGDPEADRRGADERLGVLRRLVEDFPADPVTPYALNAMVLAQVEAGRYDDALRTLDDLRARFKDFALNTQSADAGPGGEPRSLAARLEAMIKSEKEWASRTVYQHPQPNTKTMALVETTAGSFWLGFYDELAPVHVANFLELARSGYFNGTQVYDVRTAGTAESPTPMLFEAGSAASRYEGPGSTRDPGEHDRDDPSATLEPEDARYRVRHLRGVVSTVSMPSGASARRFMVVAAEGGLERYNGQNTPFAMVLDREKSFETIDRICRSATYGSDPTTKSDPEVFRMRDHPYPPVWIRRVTIWSDEKVAAGHTWDTSRAGTTQAEPWEATLPPPPKPSDFAPKTADTPKPGSETPPAPPPGEQK